MLIGTHADFAQTDPRWAGQFCGSSKTLRMAAVGCMVTAGANVAQAQGVDTDPLVLNGFLVLKGAIGGPDGATMQRNDFLSVVYPQIKFIERLDWPQQVVAPGAYFDVRNDIKTDIIIKLDYHPDIPGIQEHWCRVVGINPQKNDVEIVDSYDGKRKWLSSIASQGKKNALQIIWAAIKYSSR